MNLLANIPERFTPRERNLLVRDILDCWGNPHLAGDFCERLAKAVGISKESLDSAWCAADFHFDWLAGAACLYEGQ
jgi:hypothetical protein